MTSSDQSPRRAGFPRIFGRNLLGDEVEIPHGLEGSPRVVVLAFRQWQQSDVDSWVPFLEDRAEAHEGLRFYEVPAIAGIWTPTRRFIDGGMAAAIRAREVLERTITYYGALGELTGPLGIQDRGSIHLVLVDDDGLVAWHGSGPFSEAAAGELAAALAALTTAAVGRPRRRPGEGGEAAGGGLEAGQRFEFEWNPRYRRLLALLGVGPSNAWVTVTDDLLAVRFGRWSLETPRSNVVDVRITTDYQWFKAIGARLSLADRGVTFGTDTAGGVCVCFGEPVPGLLPGGLAPHPAVTLTVAEPERLAELLSPS